MHTAHPAPGLSSADFRLFLAGRTAAAFGEAAFLAGVLWTLLSATGSAWVSGLVPTVTGVVSLALMPVAGVWLDRPHRKRFIWGADV